MHSIIAQIGSKLQCLWHLAEGSSKYAIRHYKIKAKAFNFRSCLAAESSSTTSTSIKTQQCHIISAVFGYLSEIAESSKCVVAGPSD